jgi:hypothetical protein
MKKQYFFGLLVILLALGMTFIGCDNGTNDDDVFDGTWIGLANSQQIKIVAANGSWKQYVTIDGQEVECIRGAYTVSGNTVTAKFTEVNTIMFNEESGWSSYAGLSETHKGYLGGSDTQKITVSGNKITANGASLTKQ